MMNIAEIRLANLSTIIEEDFNREKVALAKKMGVSANNLSRYYSKNAENRRTISDSTASLIEEAAGKPSGWLSQVHDMPIHFEQMRQIMLTLTPEQQLVLVNDAAMKVVMKKLSL